MMIAITLTITIKVILSTNEKSVLIIVISNMMIQLDNSIILYAVITK